VRGQANERCDSCNYLKLLAVRLSPQAVICEFRLFAGDSYKSIIVDEAQDMGTQAFLLLRAMVREGKNDLFIVGDAHQRIYKHKVILGQCGIKIIGRSKKLLINYRTTEETRKWAVGLLKNISVDDLDGGIDDNKKYKSLLHGHEPQVKKFDSFQDEVNFIVSYLENLKQTDNSLKAVCLVARTNELVNQYESTLQNKGIITYRLSRNEPDDRRKDGVRLGTMHRVKGLEFDYIIISAVNKSYVPLNLSELNSADPSIKKQAEIRERALLYVSATRAKKGVLVTCFGEPSEFLGELYK
jgi:superfamily I DNA/RNA helicase